MEELFKKLYEGSAYTIEGCGGDINDWKNGYNNMLGETGIGHVDEFFEFTGEDMNNYYNLTGNNRYPDDLHFLSFMLDGLDVGKLAIFKLRMRDRWFDDIVDNNAMRERETLEVESDD